MADSTGAMATTAIAASGRRRASPDSTTHVQAEGATGSRVVTVSDTGIAQAVLRAGSAAADAPQVTVVALAAAGVGRNEGARSPISV
jgi:hypothetical protein